MTSPDTFFRDVHADDYALSEDSDTDILKLCEERKLDSISIIPNLKIFDSAAERLKALGRQDLSVSVHLNFMEGKSVRNKDELPHLVDKDGFFNVSWGKLLFYSYNPFLYRKVRAELEKEISAQIKKVSDSGLVPESEIRIDSHQHTHMIPIVFAALKDAVRAKDFKVSYIRNSQDPVMPYFSPAMLRHAKTYSPANIIKCLILNFFSAGVRSYLHRNNLPVQYLCGVFFSGKMDSRIKEVLPVLERKCRKENRSLEILFHPGAVLPSELTDEFTKKGFNEFHISENRRTEFNTCEDL